MFPLITSPQNPRVKSAISLRDRRGREKQGRIIIDGRREISRAVEAGVALDEVFYLPESLVEPSPPEWLSMSAGGNVKFVPVNERVLERLSFGERVEGYVATAATPEHRLQDLRLNDVPLIVVIEGVEKPGNVGAILRTADAAGASAVIVADGGTDLYNPNTIRASLGAVFSLPVCAATSESVLSFLAERAYHVFAARVDAATDYYNADFRQSTAIVLGSEAAGLTDHWTGDGITAIKLPMLGRVDSLNVSTTAAILLYEAVRQRRQMK